MNSQATPDQPASTEETSAPNTGEKRWIETPLIRTLLALGILGNLGIIIYTIFPLINSLLKL